MAKAADKSKADMPIEGLILECTKDKYRLSYAAVRWAREIKQKENLPDPLPVILQRALRELLTGQVSIKDIEKLPMIAKIVAPPPPSIPTITLNPSAVEADEKEEAASKKK